MVAVAVAFHAALEAFLGGAFTLKQLAPSAEGFACELRDADPALAHDARRGSTIQTAGGSWLARS